MRVSVAFSSTKASQSGDWDRLRNSSRVGVCNIQVHYHLFSLPPDVYFLSELPILMKAGDFIMVAVAALLLCFLASIYPASKAAALIPVEAMRYE